MNNRCSIQVEQMDNSAFVGYTKQQGPTSYNTVLAVKLSKNSLLDFPFNKTDIAISK